MRHGKSLASLIIKISGEKSTRALNKDEEREKNEPEMKEKKNFLIIQGARARDL